MTEQAYAAIHAASSDPVDDVHDLAPGFQVAIDALRDHHARAMVEQSPIAYFQDWDHSRSEDERPREGKTARAIG